MDKDKIIAEQKIEIKKLKEEIIKLKKQLGRPSKLTEQEKASVELYRMQGRTIKEIADMFDCSTRTISRILKDRTNVESQQ